MISRIFFAGMIFTIWLGASCGVGICADASHAGAATGAVKNIPDASGGSVDSARPLSPNDSISLTVYQEDDLNTKTIIDKNGMVMLPLLGQVKVSGLTVLEATQQIQQLYDKDYLVNPRVNLIVEHFAERRFSVLGQVQKPGSFEFPQNESVNLLEAIAIAGGYTRLGNPSKVDVQRIENGVPKIHHCDAGKMAKDPDPKKKQFEILPDDIINVGERTF